MFTNYTLKISTISPRGQWVNEAHCRHLYLSGAGKLYIAQTCLPPRPQMSWHLTVLGPQHVHWDGNVVILTNFCHWLHRKYMWCWLHSSHDIWNLLGLLMISNSLSLRRRSYSCWRTRLLESMELFKDRKPVDFTYGCPRLNESQWH